MSALNTWVAGSLVKPFSEREPLNSVETTLKHKLLLTPLQRSTGGQWKLGATSKMGKRTLGRLLIIGSNAVVRQVSKRGAPKGSWLEQMLARKPRMLVTVALANKMARHIWALLVKQENYRAPVVVQSLATPHTSYLRHYIVCVITRIGLNYLFHQAFLL